MNMHMKVDVALNRKELEVVLSLRERDYWLLKHGI